MNDDVTNLLVSNPNSNNYNQNFQSLITASPNISLKSFKNEFFNQMTKSPDSSFKFCPSSSENLMKEVSLNSGMAFDFELQIKKLEEKAKELRDEKAFFDNSNSTNSIIPFKLNSTNEDFKNFNSNFMNSLTPKFVSSNLLLTTSLIQSSNNLSDQKSDENFLKQIKEKLDLQLKETENLKKELKKSKTNETFVRPEQDSVDSSFRNVMISSSSNGLIDEVIDLKFKLKEALSKNEELKQNFKQNIKQLQTSFKSCILDKDKLIDKKNGKISTLEEELQYLRKSLSEHEAFLRENESYESLAYRVQSYENFVGRLSNILVTEEKKREKSYFFNEPNLSHYEKSEQKFNYEMDNLLKALGRCLEDYQGEIRHSKTMVKELQSSWEIKEKQNANKEHEISETYNKKYETIRHEYDRLMNLKQADLEKLQNEINELNNEINQLHQKNRKSIDAKDTEINNLQLNNDSLKQELSNMNKELKQLKVRFDTLKTKEKENQVSSSKTIAHLETENENLSSKCLDLNKEMVDCKQKYEALKGQISKYEQLIDNLNEQVVLLKREQKEQQINLNQLNQNLEIEVDLKNKVDSRCQELEEQVQLLREIAIKHDNCDNNLMGLQIKFQQVEQNFIKKSNEIQKLMKKNEQNETKLKSQTGLIKKLSTEKSEIESTLEKTQSELNDCKLKLQNCTNLIQHSCKTNNLIKEEKETLENILKDNAIKLKSIKDEYEQMKEYNLRLEQECSCLKTDNELINKKYDEIKKLNDIVTNEKESFQNELSQVKNELNNTQTNYKTLNKKLSQSISDKDLQISKLEQSLALYEKEINLLKQVKQLHENQEESKVIELANTVQQKLTQKNNKIDVLKNKISSLESQNNSLNKEKSQYEIELKNTLVKVETFEKEIKNLTTELNETKEKNTHLEKSLAKAAKKYSDSEKKNETLKNELAKFKNKLTNFNLSEELNKAQKLIDQSQEPKVEMNQNMLVFNKLFNAFVSTALNSNLKVFEAIQNGNDVMDNLKKNFESSDDSEEQTITSTVVEEVEHEINKELVHNIENGLNMLTNIGHDLKKENHEVTQLLMQQTTLADTKNPI